MACTAVGSARATGKTDQTIVQLWLGKPTDFIAAEIYLSTLQPLDETAQQLLQQFILQFAGSNVVQAYVAQFRQHLDGVEQQCQTCIKQSQRTELTAFVVQALPCYAMLCELLPAVSPHELYDHSQQPLSYDDMLVDNT